jgi:hypothetical protein
MMPPTRGATSEDADIAGLDRGRCSAFAWSSPYPSHRSISTKAKWTNSLHSLSPPHKAHRGTTRHGAPRHIHQLGAAAPKSQLHREL